MRKDAYFQWQVSSEEKGVRLVDFLKHNQNTNSKRKLKKAIEIGLCQINGKVELFACKKLQKKDFVSLHKSWLKLLREDSKNEDFQTLFEDEDLLIINKPRGFVCTPGEIYKVFLKKFKLIHRLDKNTSGVLILAKNNETKAKMIELFSKRVIKKNYFVLVDGFIKKDRGKIENFLVKKGYFHGQTVWNISSQRGIYALTMWRCIKKNKNISALHCLPVTGRMHQIRVHLAAIGHPILGDFQYCKSFKYPYFVNRLCLHASSVEFSHPTTNKHHILRAPLPLQFSTILEKEFENKTI